MKKILDNIDENSPLYPIKQKFFSLYSANIKESFGDLMDELGLKVDAILNENEMVKGEVYTPTERIKVYILEVKDTTKGPKILVSRTHPELVKRLFESEVTEVRDVHRSCVKVDTNVELMLVLIESH